MSVLINKVICALHCVQSHLLNIRIFLPVASVYSLVVNVQQRGNQVNGRLSRIVVRQRKQAFGIEEKIRRSSTKTYPKEHELGQIKRDESVHLVDP